MTERELSPKVAVVFAALAEDAPVRDGEQLPNADAAVVKLLAEVLVRIDRIADYLDRKGWGKDEDGNPRPVLDYERRSCGGHAARVDARYAGADAERHALKLGLRPDPRHRCRRGCPRRPRGPRTPRPATSGR